MKIAANVLDRQFLLYQSEYEAKALHVLRNGWYVLGQEVEAFEKEFASYIGTKYCVGLASGLDALWISMHLLGIKAEDEVIVQSNAYIACVMGITINGAVPVFVEPDEYYNIDVDQIEAKITARTKAILVVHLYGQASNMEKIMKVAEKYHLLVVEDCAQSHGVCFEGKRTGTFGSFGCFSFYPSKNLGCFGDGGALVTDDAALAEKARTFRNYGSQKRYYNEVVGTNSRLDELQAGLLRVKLSHLPELTAEREQIAKKYIAGIRNKWLELPEVRSGATHVWHLFVVRTKYREQLMAYLQDKEVGYQIHYPIPPHLSEAYAYLQVKKGDLPIAEQYAAEVLTLPLYNGMQKDEIAYVINTLNGFEV